jgi:hypothetical protein
MQEYANQIKSKEVQDYHVDHAHKIKTESDVLFTIKEMDKEQLVREKKDQSNKVKEELFSDGIPKSVIAKQKILE